MGKKGGLSQNPIEAHRRQQQKKELKKNKEKRIRDRDEHVKQTKTVQEVKKEIAEFERRHKGQLQQHAIKSKLDRLQKELKLVQQHEEEERKNQKHHQSGVSNKYAAPKSSFQKLDRPEMSVYFDAQYNPYGAPPPGKPMLFHRWGGGVTMKIHEAVVPGEEPPQPPWMTQQQQQQQQQSRPLQQQTPPQGRRPGHPPRPQQQRSQSPRAKPASHENTQNLLPPPPPPPPLPKEPPPPPPPPAVIAKDDIPNLPPPSAAVIRLQKSKRNKNKKGAAADIWASTDEVEYERQVEGVDLEDAAAAAVEIPKLDGTREDDIWWYVDTQGNTQGTYSTAHMHSWYAAGYFPATTLVQRQRGMSTFCAVGKLGDQVFVVARQKQSTRTKQQQEPVKPVKQLTVQDRIKALRQHRQSSLPDAEEDVVDEAVEERIAAMRRTLLQNQGGGNEGSAQKTTEEWGERVTDGDVDVDESIRDRIASFRQPPQEPSKIPGTESSDNNQEEGHERDHLSSLEDRIAALRSNTTGSLVKDYALEVQTLVAQGPNGVVAASQEQPSELDNNDDHVAPPPAASGEGPIMASYPADPNEDDVPPPYPLVEDSVAGGDQEKAATYPVNEDAYPADASYPVDTDYPVDAPYPSDDAYPVDNDAAYPVTDFYPVDDDAAYPVTDAYPVDEPIDSMADSAVPAYPIPAAAEEEDGRDGSSLSATEPPKKKIKVDKALVSLLPSHLQKRRPGKK